MKTLIITFILIVFVSLNNLNGQSVYFTDSRDYPAYDLSDNLDLEAMAYVFAKSSSIKSFERKLNSSNYNISNLDLNNDGYIDYLRVLEFRQRGFSVLFVQAVLGRDMYQDVATIEVKNLRNGRVAIQVIGDEYLFGYNYIIEPVFWRKPVIAGYFYRNHRHVWYSPYVWDDYPIHFELRVPLRISVYQWNVMNRFSSRMVFSYPQKHYFEIKHYDVHHYYRHDYAHHHPKHSFKHRNEGFKNQNERRKKYYDDNHRYLENNKHDSGNQSNDRYHNRNKNNSDYRSKENRNYSRDLNRKVEKSNYSFRKKENDQHNDGNRRKYEDNRSRKQNEVSNKDRSRRSVEKSNNYTERKKVSRESNAVKKQKPRNTSRKTTTPSRESKTKKDNKDNRRSRR